MPGAKARHLGKVDAQEFVDRRNPDPIINIGPREFEPDPSVTIEEHEGQWLSVLPNVPNPYWLNVGSFNIPQPITTGYDYEDADQPVLVECWIEKSTMNDILEPLCEELGINLVPASGMQSISSAVRLLERCREHEKPGHVIYISDFDMAGENMPRAVARQVEFYRERDFSDVEVSLVQVALTYEQVADLQLPRKPVAKADVRAPKFEATFGEGVVELDALEALHPGYLEQVVRDAVEPYRDPDLPRRLAPTSIAARLDAREQWAQETSDLRSELDELAADAREIAEPFRTRLTELHQEFEQAIAPIRERAGELESELDERWEAFEPDLPERPEAEPPDVDDDVLFDSRRDWLDQLERYKEDQ